MSNSTTKPGRFRAAFGKTRSSASLAAVAGPIDAWPTLQMRLAAALAEPIGPAALTAAPVVTINPKAADTYEEIGENDARHPGVDEHTGPHRPEQPSADAVRNSSGAPIDRLGERWEQTKTLYETGRLGHVPPKEIHLFRELTRRTWHLWLILAVVITAGVTAELVYGVRAAALLTVADPVTALVGTIAFSLAMNSLSWYAGDLLFVSNQNVVRRSGTRFALVAGILIAILVTILGLVVGGFDPLQLSTIDGGGAAEPDTAGLNARWTLAGAYTLILAIVSASIAAGHLLILDKNADLKVALPTDAEHAAKRQSLDLAQQTALMISLGEAIIKAIPAAHRVGRHYVTTYNASFRHHAPLVISEMFLDVEYDNKDPDWLPALHDYLDRLRGPGGRKASITRIA